MSRIFLALSLFAVVLLSANLLVGLTIGDFGAASRTFQSAYHEYDGLADAASDRQALEQSESQLEEAAKQLKEQRSAFWLHIWLGMSAALVTLLVNSISVTYFIGTNRWCREVVDAFSLDQALAERSQRLKKRAFPWSLLAILLILFIAGLGAASDPVTLNPNAADWVPYHWGLAMLGIVVIGGCLLAQVALIGKNYELINEVLVAAEEERERRKAAREPLAEG
ncbi:MAG: hypothetical protein H6823_05830 [Planctomycetaceae bacterium]|nr:hypothetical protein [Planctomycetales bacterium]MCB9937740.1 hypothetical protein [Planctomycetaceae bacterium]